MERGSMPMSKNKKILMMLAKGGASQSEIAAALHVSKRDVSSGTKAIREYDPTCYHKCKNSPISPTQIGYYEPK